MKPLQKRGSRSLRKLSVSFIIITFTLLVLPNQSQALIPDLSQTNNPAWSFFCAPAAATNPLWAYSANDAGLIQAGVGNNQKADNTITTLAGAAYMNTNVGGNGTLVVNMVNGLQGYANNFSNNGAGYYTVSLLTAFNTGTGGGMGSGQTLWNAMTTAFSNGEQVLPIINFIGPPANHGNVEYGRLDYEDDNLNPLGHVVTMTGSNINQIIVNDPGNNGGPLPQHNWLGENAAWNLNPLLPTSISITSGPYINKWLVGAVTMSAIPEPSSLILISSGLVGIITLRRRKNR